MGKRKNISIRLDFPFELSYSFKHDCFLRGIAFYDTINGLPVEVTKDIELAGHIIIPKHSSNILNHPADGSYFPETMSINQKMYKNESINGAFLTEGKIVVLLNIEEDA